MFDFNPLNTELNPTCHLLALSGAHHILHVSRIWVNLPVFIIVCSTTGVAQLKVNAKWMQPQITRRRCVTFTFRSPYPTDTVDESHYMSGFVRQESDVGTVENVQTSDFAGN